MAAQVISTLNSLIEVNRDGQHGFKKAAEKIEAPQIKQFCFEQSRSHACGPPLCGQITC